MALPVAFDLMNLAAVIVLATVVLVEKAGPWGSRLSRLLGLAALVLAVVADFAPHVAPGLMPHGAGATGTTSQP